MSELNTLGKSVCSEGSKDVDMPNTCAIALSGYVGVCNELSRFVVCKKN